MSDITLHPKLGLNPSLGVCFFCQKENGTVVLLGLNKGKEAPKRVATSYEPCDTCKKMWAQGIALIGVKDEPLVEGQREIDRGRYPTGNWAVVTPESIRRNINDAALAEEVIKKGVAFVDDEILQSMPKEASTQH